MQRKRRQRQREGQQLRVEAEEVSKREQQVQVIEAEEGKQLHTDTPHIGQLDLTRIESLSYVLLLPLYEVLRRQWPLGREFAHHRAPLLDRSEAREKKRRPVSGCMFIVSASPCTSVSFSAHQDPS